MKFKGPTVMKNEERYSAVRQCKWVDEVIEDVPYVTSLEMVKKFGVHYVVHGEDITYDENGNCSYSEVMDAGMFLLIQRTRGVSTTDIVGRMLTMTNKDEQIPNSPLSNSRTEKYMEGVLARPTEFLVPYNPYDPPIRNKYLLTTKQLIAFSTPSRKLESHYKIVYVDGGFDMFHVGHGEFLRKCRELGDYLIVGLHEDSDIAFHKGENYPIMNLYERCLSVLSCKYVDDIIIGSPFIVTEKLLSDYNIHLVCHGSVFEKEVRSDPYAVPKKLGIYREVESPLPKITTSVIVKRIIDNSKEYEERNRKKLEKDQLHSGNYVEGVSQI